MASTMEPTITSEPQMVRVGQSPNRPRKRAVWQGKIVWRAILDSFVKLDPRHMMGNPVMFVVEVGSVITTVLLFRGRGDFAFNLQITLWLWFTVLFANFAEAMAEGRGKAQADTLRKARSETIANREREDGDIEKIPSSKLRAGDVVVVSAGELVPSDGEIIEGVASVDESAITGESAPVIRESGGDRSAVTGGTRVLSDQIRVKVTSNPGETFLDRMIALVEGAERQKTPNEIALNILLAGLTIIFLLAVVTLQPFAIYSGAPQTVFVLVSLLVCLIPTTIGGLLSAIGIAGMDRLIQHNVLAMSGRAVEAAGDVNPPACCVKYPGPSNSNRFLLWSSINKLSSAGSAVLKLAGQRLRRLRKPFERNIQRHFLIRAIRKRFNLQYSRGQGISPRQFLQLPKRFRQLRRQHRALIDRQDMRALGQKIAERPRHRIPKCPLRPIPVTIRLRGMLPDFARPLHAAESRQRLAQNLLLQPHLLADLDVLVMASPANAKMRARRELSAKATPSPLPAGWHGSASSSATAPTARTCSPGSTNGTNTVFPSACANPSPP